VGVLAPQPGPHTEFALTDLARWSSAASYEAFWDDRAKAAAALLGSARWLCDLGCGQQSLRRFLPDNMHYMPADLVAWDRRVALCDLNSNKWPDLYLQACEIVYVLGVLEYVLSPQQVLSHLARSCPELVISYNPCDMSDVNRQGFGWMNAFTAADFLDLLRTCGYQILSNTVFARTQIIVKARSAVESPLNILRRPLVQGLLQIQDWYRE